VLLCTSGLILLVSASSWWRSQIDDLFISIGYALRLAAGQGLTFPGQGPVEGYSNFLLVMALSAGAAADIDTASLAKGLSMLSGMLCLAFLIHTSRSSATWPVWAVALAANASFGRWAASGMETLWFALLLAIGWTHVKLGASRVAVVALVAAAATRPEGFVHLLAALLLLGRSALTGTTFLSLSAYGAYNAWRYAYFGHMTALPTLVKTTVPYTSYGLHQGLGDWLLLCGPALLAAAPTRNWKVRDALTALAPAAIQLAALWRVSGDWMAGGRITLPAAIAVTCVLATGASGKAKRVPLLAGVLLAIAGVATIPTGYGDPSASLRPRPSPGAFISGLDTPLQEDVAWVVENVPAGATIASVDAGFLGLISDVPLFDVRGLNCPTMAHALRTGNPEAVLIAALRDAGTAVHYRQATWPGEQADGVPPAIADLLPHQRVLTYGGGTIIWRSASTETAATGTRHRRWRDLYDRFPSLRFVAMNAAIAMLEAGDVEGARMLAQSKSAAWPRDVWFRDLPESGSFVGGPSEATWTGNRGFRLPPEGQLRTRDLSRSRPAWLCLDSDASVTVELQWAGCDGDIPPGEVRVPARLPTPSALCGPDDSFRGTVSNPAGGSDVFVKLSDQCGNSSSATAPASHPL